MKVSLISVFAMDDAVVRDSLLSDKTKQIEELKAFIRKERDGRQVKKASGQTVVSGSRLPVSG